MGNLNEEDAKLSVDTILSSMTKAITAGNRIEIRDFGNFSLRYNSPRKSHNPKTGEGLITSSKYRIRFKMGKKLWEYVNSSNF